MAAPRSLIVVLGLLLSGVPLPASARLSPVNSALNNDNYQLVANNWSDPYKVLLAVEKHVIVRQNDDVKRRKEMSPEQRKHLKARRERFESLPPQEKQRLKDTRKKFKQLPPEERKRLKQKWRDLSPEERDRAINKKRQKKA